MGADGDDFPSTPGTLVVLANQIVGGHGMPSRLTGNPRMTESPRKAKTFWSELSENVDPPPGAQSWPVGDHGLARPRGLRGRVRRNARAGARRGPALRLSSQPGGAPVAHRTQR